MEKDKDPRQNQSSRIKRWFSLVWKTYTTEFEDRVLSSPKRLIKFFGISIIPIIYGVICIIAFWNPIENIGRAPMAVMDQDRAVVLVESTRKNPLDGSSDQTNEYLYGPLADISGIGVKDINALMGYGGNEENGITQSESGAWLVPSKVVDTEQKVAEFEAALLKLLNDATSPTITLTSRTNGSQSSFTYDRTNPTFSLKVTSGWTVLKSALQPKKDPTQSDLDHTFKSNKIKGYQLTDLRYLNDPKEIDHQWEGTKYYVQMKIPDGFSEKILTYIGTMFSENIDNDAEFLRELVNMMQPINVWTTFQRNFIFGYYLNTISSVIDGVFLTSIPSIFNTVLTNNTGARISYKGAVVKTLMGAGVGEEFYLEGENGPTKIEDTTLYIMPNASLLPQNSGNNANIKDYTVFGDIDAGDNSGASASDVGGKFIGLLKMVLNTSPDSPIIKRLLNIANAIGIGADAQNMINLIMRVIDAIKGVLGTGQIDQILIDLNKDTYLITTGQKNIGSSELFSKLLKAVWKALTDQDLDLTKLNVTPIFTTKAIMTKEQFITNLDTNISNNSTYLLGAKSVKELLPKIFAAILANATYGLNRDKITTLTIQGAKFGLYGIGLGEFFLLIGLYVGSLLQSFIFDRAKRTKQATASSWYVGKWMLFVTIGIIQATLLTWVTYAVGWHQLGAATMCYIWLWLVFSEIIFMTIILGIWFSIEDEAIGRFCCVLVLVFSLTAGGGTFPAFSQFGFFQAISYLVPFTYVLKGLGEIVYGVSSLGTNAVSTGFIFTQFGILLIYFVLFMALGLLVGSRLLMRQMNWGSQRGKVVALAMLQLDRTEELQNFRTEKAPSKFCRGKQRKTRYHYNWKTLAPDFDEELYFECRKIRLDDGFKWWKRKDHDFVQKPNYSDEDTITRNE